MRPLLWPWILSWGLAVGVIGAACSAFAPAPPTPPPEGTPAVVSIPGIQEILPPPQYSRSVIHEPAVTDTEDSQAAEYETSLGAAAVIQFYKEELSRRGWAQEWEIAEEGQHQMGFGRGQTEMVIVVVTEDASVGEGASPPSKPTLVGIIYIVIKD